MPPEGLRRSPLGRGVDRVESRDDERDVVARPGVIGLGEQRFRGRLGIGLGGERRDDCLVRDHLRQSVGAQQQAIARLDLERVSFDVDPKLVPPSTLVIT